jgi:Icc-related predicted phosphoesterase
MTRILFSCDTHGSDLLWKKIVRACSFHKADTILISGDLTGKAIAPIVKQKPNEWYLSWGRDKGTLHSQKELEAAIKRIRDRGYYPYETTWDEVNELKKNPKALPALFDRIMREDIKRWLEFAEQHLPKDAKAIVVPGNDDSFEIDEIIIENKRFIMPLNQVVQLDDRHQMISCEWVNSTPWDTPRECPEKELKEKLEAEFKRVDNYDNLVCNFHAPPHGTPLDVAPKLDKELKPMQSWGQIVMTNVGSKAVKELIEKYKPLLTLHGHIHESNGFIRIGRTLCMNPGSEYTHGVLRAYVIDLPSSSDEEIQFYYVNA